MVMSSSCRSSLCEASRYSGSLTIPTAPYSFWAACRAHALNLVAMHTAKDHPVIHASYDLVSSTFALLGMAHANSDVFGSACPLWRGSTDSGSGGTAICAVLETPAGVRMSARCAHRLTDCLKGVVMQQARP